MARVKMKWSGVMNGMHTEEFEIELEDKDMNTHELSKEAIGVFALYDDCGGNFEDMTRKINGTNKKSTD